MQPITPESNVVMEASFGKMEARLPSDAYQKLEESISFNELGSAAKELAHGKSPRSNGQAIEFYMKLWPIIDLEFHSMILWSIFIGELPKGMKSRLIALLHKRGPTNLITNYRPITILNVSYRFFAKALQK